MKKDVDKILKELIKYGLLLQADAHLPSIAKIIIGTPFKGSWWGHPKGNLIYNTAMEIEDREDVLSVKLVSGKITYIHKSLWAPLVEIGLTQKDWQFEKLSTHGKKLLESVENKGQWRLDLETFEKLSTKELGVTAKYLEKRLLVYGTSIHTEKGSHAKILESWTSLKKRKKIPTLVQRKENPKLIFENIINSWKEEFKSKATLPWPKNN